MIDRRWSCEWVLRGLLCEQISKVCYWSECFLEFKGLVQIKKHLSYQWLKYKLNCKSEMQGNCLTYVDNSLYELNFLWNNNNNKVNLNSDFYNYRYYRMIIWFEADVKSLNIYSINLASKRITPNSSTNHIYPKDSSSNYEQHLMHLINHQHKPC